MVGSALAYTSTDRLGVSERLTGLAAMTEDLKKFHQTEYTEECQACR